MIQYKDLGKEQLQKLISELEVEFQGLQNENLQLDLSRGRPSVEQLDLSNPLLDVVNSKSEFTDSTGMDARNYGAIEGIPEVKQFMADFSEMPVENTIVSGASSLRLMFDIIAHFMLHGVAGGKPWSTVEGRKFLCPAPGFDRHFDMVEYFGFQLITIPILSTGPDMDMIEELVASDDTIKGIWCVPKYSNPDGVTYSDETVQRLASLKTAAKDFKIFWDNAYAVHEIYEDRHHQLANIHKEAVKADQEDIFYQFVSMSKITFAGGGISAVTASEKNLDEVRKLINAQMISYDKVNQLRHLRFFKDVDGLKDHMKKQAAIVRPKFLKVLEVLQKELGDLGIGTWSDPVGGYFIAYTSMEGCAKSIIEKAKAAGLVMTPAGSTFPYGVDPRDNSIRIAPTFASMDELELALKILVLSIKLSSLQKLLHDM